MKKIIIASAALLISVAALAQDARSIYNKYSNEKGVSAVYISPSMFRFIGKLPELEIADEDIDISKIVRSLDGMYILNTERQDLKARLVEDMQKFVNSGKFELLMEAKEDGEAMRMYKISKGNVITSFVMIADDDEETAFICFSGKILEEDLMEMIAAASE